MKARRATAFTKPQYGGSWVILILGLRRFGAVQSERRAAPSAKWRQIESSVDKIFLKNLPRELQQQIRANRKPVREQLSFQEAQAIRSGTAPCCQSVLVRLRALDMRLTNGFCRSVTQTARTCCRHSVFQAWTGNFGTARVSFRAAQGRSERKRIRTIAARRSRPDAAAQAITGVFHAAKPMRYAGVLCGRARSLTWQLTQDVLERLPDATACAAASVL